jgi:hypothetical protein
LWVVKTEHHEIHAYCPECEADEAMVSNWQDTSWAEGHGPAVDLAALHRAERVDPLDVN